MRTTAFAFLGLTAAAGLALVAIFAQLSFHVLSPAPLPAASPGTGAVAAGVPLRQQRRPAIASARAAATASPATSAGSRAALSPEPEAGRAQSTAKPCRLPGESAGQAPAGQDPPEPCLLPNRRPRPRPHRLKAQPGKRPPPLRSQLPFPNRCPGRASRLPSPPAPTRKRPTTTTLAPATGGKATRAGEAKAGQALEAGAFQARSRAGTGTLR